MGSENSTFTSPHPTTSETIAATTWEWLYYLGDDDFYVWFAGEPGDIDGWTVILTGRYPRDAVY